MADGYGHTLFFDRSPANFELVAEFLRSSVQLPAVLPEGVTLESIYSDAVYYGVFIRVVCFGRMFHEVLNVNIGINVYII